MGHANRRRGNALLRPALPGTGHRPHRSGPAARPRPGPAPPHAEAISLIGAQKSMSAGVDIERWRGYGFSRSPERQQGLAETNCRADVRKSQFAGRYGSGVPKPERVQDGDGSDGRTGWPAVIRGRHEQHTQVAVQYQWFLGKGVGCGRACREVRQWGSKPEQTQDGQRGWLPEEWRSLRSPAVRITSSTEQCAVPAVGK